MTVGEWYMTTFLASSQISLAQILLSHAQSKKANWQINENKRNLRWYSSERVARASWPCIPGIELGDCLWHNFQPTVPRQVAIGKGRNTSPESRDKSTTSSRMGALGFSVSTIFGFCTKNLRVLVSVAICDFCSISLSISGFGQKSNRMFVDVVWFLSGFSAKNTRVNDLNTAHVFSDSACSFLLCSFTVFSFFEKNGFAVANTLQCPPPHAMFLQQLHNPNLYLEKKNN